MTGMAVSVPCSQYTTWNWADNQEMPENRNARIPAIISRVTAALRGWGTRNAGMPLLMASTPVRAEHPLAKALRISNARAASISGPAWNASGGIVWLTFSG